MNHMLVDLVRYALGRGLPPGLVDFLPVRIAPCWKDPHPARQPDPHADSPEEAQADGTEGQCGTFRSDEGPVAGDLGGHQHDHSHGQCYRPALRSDHGP